MLRRSGSTPTRRASSASKPASLASPSSASERRCWSSRCAFDDLTVRARCPARIPLHRSRPGSAQHQWQEISAPAGGLPPGCGTTRHGARWPPTGQGPRTQSQRRGLARQSQVMPGAARTRPGRRPCRSRCPWRPRSCSRHGGAVASDSSDAIVCSIRGNRGSTALGLEGCPARTVRSSVGLSRESQGAGDRLD